MENNNNNTMATPPHIGPCIKAQAEQTITKTSIGNLIILGIASSVIKAILLTPYNTTLNYAPLAKT